MFICFPLDNVITVVTLDNLEIKNETIVVKPCRIIFIKKLFNEIA